MPNKRSTGGLLKRGVIFNTLSQMREKWRKFNNESYIATSISENYVALWQEEDITTIL